ncbi:MAG: hypothetical protein U1F33_08270 [Alphaproteobacteria bacterium]
MAVTERDRVIPAMAMLKGDRIVPEAAEPWRAARAALHRTVTVVITLVRERIDSPQHLVLQPIEQRPEVPSAMATMFVIAVVMAMVMMIVAMMVTVVMMMVVMMMTPTADCRSAHAHDREILPFLFSQSLRHVIRHDGDTRSFSGGAHDALSLPECQMNLTLCVRIFFTAAFCESN